MVNEWETILFPKFFSLNNCLFVIFYIIDTIDFSMKYYSLSLIFFLFDILWHLKDGIFISIIENLIISVQCLKNHADS